MKQKLRPARIRHRTALVAAVTFILGLVITIYYTGNVRKREQLKARYTAESTVASVETQLNRYLAESDLLKRIVESGTDINKLDFARLSELMTDENHVIKAIELAPGGVVQNVYPLQGNADAIGLDMLHHPARQYEANLAKDTGHYTIAGPYELVQGGTGALLFDPIYTTDANGGQTFWGFSLLVLDWENFLEQVQLDKLERANYEYYIWKYGPDEQKVTVAQGARLPQQDTLEVACAVPNDTWYFEIHPVTGWVTLPQKILDTILLFLLPALTAAGYWQASMRRYKEEVHAQELEKSAREAQAANDAKTRFLFNMSHDIRTPMNAIIGYAELLEAHLDEHDRAVDYVQKIRSSSDFLLSLINYVLEMARIESGKATLKPELSNVKELLQSLQAVFEPLAEKKQIQYTCTTEITHWNIMGDRTKTREIFLNIISNAIKYTPEGGHVSLKVTELPGTEPGTLRYQVVVQDDGIGMSAEYLPHLFEEFTRERTTTESRVTGTGLGMPIVKSLVDLMHGTIDVESAVGKGTTFTVVLPFAIAEEEKQLPVADDRAAAAVELAGKRLLLAEDNDLNAEIAVTFLQENSIAVDRVADGEACVDALREKPAGYYDLILMDIQMPKMDGYAATKAIRALPDSRADIPIIAMTANAFDEDKHHAIEAGMNGHIAKPISVKTLLDTLRKNLK